VGDWKYFDSHGRAYSGFEEILRLLAAKGFTGAVFIPSELKSNTDLLEEIRKYREAGNSFKCWFFPWLNPQRQEDLRFAQDHIQDIDGMKFHPSLDRVRFTDENHRDFLEVAKSHDLPILVHCGGWIEMAHYRFVLDVAEAYPGVNFILAHQGGTTYELKTGAAAEVRRRALDNVYCDIAGTHEYWILEQCVAELGADKFLMGSDFPLRDAAIYPVLLDGCRLNETIKEMIRGANIMKLLLRKKKTVRILQGDWAK
jgi:predicted TIM-barrel fold metal-dependent hydrolase